MGDSRKVGKGRGAVYASDGKTYLEGASIPADVTVGDHVFSDVDEVEGNVTVAMVKPITADADADEASADTPDEDSDEEPPAETDAARGTIDEVLARVESGEVTAADALAAEQAKGDKARSTLVEKLEGLVTPAA